MCEIKFSENEYIVSENFLKDIKKKINDFRNYTKTKYAIYPTLITTHGVVDNMYADEIQSLVVAKDLFEN